MLDAFNLVLNNGFITSVDIAFISSRINLDTRLITDLDVEDWECKVAVENDLIFFLAIALQFFVSLVL